MSFTSLRPEYVDTVSYCSHSCSKGMKPFLRSVPMGAYALYSVRESVVL